MSQFDPEQFILEPREDAFYELKKDELISLAKHLKLEVKKAMRKHQIQDIFVKHLVSLKVFEEAVLETYETFDAEDKKLQFQLELKTESITKWSNFNLQWTKILYQNNLNNIAFLFFYAFQGLQM